MNIYQFVFLHFIWGCVAGVLSLVAYNSHKKGTFKDDGGAQCACVLASMLWTSLTLWLLEKFYFWLGTL